MMYLYNDFYPFQMFGFGSLFMILLWAFVIFGLVSFFRGGRSWNNRDRSMEILKERYAQGEITKEQFESIKKDLK